MCIPNCMHHTDLGLFQYQLWFIVELLNLRHGSSLIRILEKHLSQISHYPNLKVFKNGFKRLKRLIALKYQDLMRITLFALDDLISDKKLNKNLYDLFSLWINIYIWSWKSKYTKFDLHKFEANSLISNDSMKN